MKTINCNNTDDLNLVDKVSIKKLKKKSKYLRKMKQKNGNLNLFEQSGQVKESLYSNRCLDSYYEEDYV